MITISLLVWLFKALKINQNDLIEYLKDVVFGGEFKELNYKEDGDFLMPEEEFHQALLLLETFNCLAKTLDESYYELKDLMTLVIMEMYLKGVNGYLDLKISGHWAQETPEDNREPTGLVYFYHPGWGQVSIHTFITENEVREYLGDLCTEKDKLTNCNVTEWSGYRRQFEALYCFSSSRYRELLIKEEEEYSKKLYRSC